MMKLKTALTVCGVLILLVGILWTAQGTGLFPYPASSFMINQMPWVIRGVVLAIIGIAVIWGARKFVK